MTKPNDSWNLCVTLPIVPFLDKMNILVTLPSNQMELRCSLYLQVDRVIIDDATNITRKFTSNSVTLSILQGPRQMGVNRNIKVHFMAPIRNVRLFDITID